MEKKEFVSKLSELLRMAKPHLVKCEYFLGKDVPPTPSELKYPEFNAKRHPEDEYVVVTCENGYRYEVNVSCNSLVAIAEAVFKQMACK